MTKFSKNKKILLRGLAVNKGLVVGKVRIVSEKGPMNDKLLAAKLYKVKKDEILVTEMTRPLFVICMREISAIVTDRGGILCHAAMVAREFGLPCVVNTKEATRKLKNGQKIMLDANKGIIYET